MSDRILRVDPADNILIALADLRAGERFEDAGGAVTLAEDIPQKHKFAIQAFAAGDSVIMYGVKIGIAVQPIAAGGRITTANIRHDSASFSTEARIAAPPWRAPDVSRWSSQTFQGYFRSDGRVGTRNYWLVVPLVFCENRSLMVLKQAFEEELGFAMPPIYRRQVADLVRQYREGRLGDGGPATVAEAPSRVEAVPIFANLDGIKFLLHEGGCGCTREDARNLCGLIACYFHHPNVAGATVLSLGCQNAQVAILEEEVSKRGARHNKPLLIFERQKYGSEWNMLSRAVRATFLGLAAANEVTRQPAPLAHLSLGLKCGGSDGFSGLSANPAIGHAADILAAVGGRGLLAEFPELCGVEQELIDRCVDLERAERFATLMRDYAARAAAVHSGFESNPSPGNIRDGLITDAMKSAGAAKKGGTSPVADVLDYTEISSRPGLNLVCTPGNDVECVTAQVAAGSNVVVFTTGLGTPTGNPIAPVVKISSNSRLATRMADIIDFDTGPIIDGQSTIADSGEAILDLVVRVASGSARTKAEQRGQDDFIPWKRGISL